MTDKPELEEVSDEELEAGDLPIPENQGMEGLIDGSEA